MSDLTLAARERYTFRDLDRQINAGTFERTVAAPAKLSTALRDRLPTPVPAFKDRDVKQVHENPCIAAALYCDKDSEVMQYALSHNLSPALVARYQLQLPDKKLIAARLHELLAKQDEAGDE